MPLLELLACQPASITPRDFMHFLSHILDMLYETKWAKKQLCRPLLLADVASAQHLQVYKKRAGECEKKIQINTPISCSNKTG